MEKKAVENDKKKKMKSKSTNMGDKMESLKFTIRLIVIKVLQNKKIMY